MDVPAQLFFGIRVAKDLEEADHGLEPADCCNIWKVWSTKYGLSSKMRIDRTESILAVCETDNAADEETFPVCKQRVVSSFADHVEFN